MEMEFTGTFDFSEIEDKMTSICEDTLQDYDFSEPISEWFNENFDISEQIGRIDLSDYIDTDPDIEGEVRDLLHSYTPGNGCSTGEATTDAIARAMKYIAHKNQDEVSKTIMWAIKEELRVFIKEVINETISADVKTAVASIIVDALSPITNTNQQTNVANTEVTYFSAQNR